MKDPNNLPPVHIEGWPSEAPLRVVLVFVSLAIWGLIILSILGLIYALAIGGFLFLVHLMFVAHVRGSAVRLGPEQFPELDQRVRELAARAGLKNAPDAYLMQAGGTLNAFATKFLRSKMIILFSDLLDACGENLAARDMIIGHELGHIKAGHLNWTWLHAPGSFVPFLGAAYSRAREYTCDRYGAALCGDKRGALAGLAIFSAGSKRGPSVNLQALVQQRNDMNTGWLTLARWLMGHPPLCDRIAALNPDLAGNLQDSSWASARALAIVGTVGLLPLLVSSLLFVRVWPEVEAALNQAALARQENSALLETEAFAKVREDFGTLSDLIEEFRQRTGRLPESSQAVYSAWRKLRLHQPEPIDPYDGLRYGYVPVGAFYYLTSSGLDGLSDTEDDLTFDSWQSSLFVEAGQ